jgi:DNA-directed RNA polymerase specialized sigma24 family protein
MREHHGMSYDEIADAVDLPLGTLKSILHRSRERLRRALTTAGVAP